VWNAPASAQQQQPAAWGNTSQPQQPAAWNAPAQPQPQQQGGWDASAQQQQPAAWNAPAQPQPQQQAGWSQPGIGGAPSQSWDQTSASQDPWAQQPSAPAWGGQNNQQQAPTAYGGGAPAQPWGGQAAQAADPWGQPVQQQMQPGAQASWPGSVAQPSTTPPGGNPPVPSWQQPAQGYGQSQQGFGASPLASPDGDRTVLRPSGAGAPASQGQLGVVRIEEGKEPGRVYEVRKESLSIGRSRESDIFLEDLAVSRLHASIISIGSGNYALRDEGSANGTKVNGQTVNKYQPYTLQEGDKIQLGQTVLVFARR
jgi:FHA domain